MAEWSAKRFWEAATVARGEAGFEVLLDSRPVRTPAKARLSVPTKALAKAIAAEWDAQEEQIDPASMPLTRLANSAIDKVALQRTEVAALVADYACSDLLCYRADGPASLSVRQAQIWDPFLEWIHETHDLSFCCQAGIMPIDQPASTIRQAAQMTASMGAFSLTSFHEYVTLTGSWVLGLAAFQRTHEAKDIWEASILDALWQEEHWGADEEAQAERATKEAAFHDALMFRSLAEAEGYTSA